MTDDRIPPQTVKSYASGIQARQAVRDAERRQNPLLPNLAQASVSHRPESPKTLEEMGREQRADMVRPGGAEEPPLERSLSPQTIEALKAVKAAQDAKTAEKAEKEKVEPLPEPEDEDEDGLDPQDVVFARALKQAKREVIQNERERKAVAARVLPIDLADGLLTGEFTQLVPIVPNTLEVVFRCMTPAENNALRLMIFADVSKDAARERMTTELLAFYQTVAMVVSINKNTFPKHMTPTGQYGQLEFQQDVFERKLAAFAGYPLPLMSSLSVHGGWFEQRVRDLFTTTEALKNG